MEEVANKLEHCVVQGIAASWADHLVQQSAWTYWLGPAGDQPTALTRVEIDAMTLGL